MVPPDQSLFYSAVHGTKKRQASTNYVPYTGPTFEDFNYTDAQRALCNNLRSCLFDLAITGSEELANFSRQVTENTALLQQTLSKLIINFVCSS